MTKKIDQWGEWELKASSDKIKTWFLIKPNQTFQTMQTEFTNDENIRQLKIKKDIYAQLLAKKAALISENMYNNEYESDILELKTELGL